MILHKTRKTLDKRVWGRKGTIQGHIRAELKRLARQVWKLYPESGQTRCVEEATENSTRCRVLNEVLDIIKGAMR